MAYKPHDQSFVDELAAKATLLLDNDSSDYDGFGYDYNGNDRYEQLRFARERAAATSPWKPGHIVYADLHGDDAPPVKVLVLRLHLEWSDRADEFVNHIMGFPMRSNGKGFTRLRRRVFRGDITRGYEKARNLGLLPAEA